MVSKKMLMNAIAGVASIAALGISTFAFAGGDFVPTPVPTAGCDMGNPGFYVGGRVGYGNNYWDNIDYTRTQVVPDFRFNGFLDANRRVPDVLTVSRTTKHTGFSGGAEIGYAFNKFLALEVGVMSLPRAKVTHERLLNGLPFARVENRRFDRFNRFNRFNRLNDLGRFGNFTHKINNYAFDISGKISVMFPGVDNVGLFAKAGVGFLQSQFKHRNDGNWGWGGNNWGGWGDDHDRTRSNTNLTYGFGIFWNFTPNMTLDGRFQRWHGDSSFVGGHRQADNHGGNWGGHHHHDGYQPFMDAYTIGLTYHIDGTGDLFNT